MKKYLVSLMVAVVLVGAVIGLGCAKALDSKKDKASYSIGWDIGSNFKRQSLDVNVDVLMKGIKDALAGNESDLAI